MTLDATFEITVHHNTSFKKQWTENVTSHKPTASHTYMASVNGSTGVIYARKIGQNTQN